MPPSRLHRANILLSEYSRHYSLIKSHGNLRTYYALYHTFTKQCIIFELLYKVGLKIFEPQLKDGIANFCYSSITIVHALKDYSGNFSHFGLSVVMRQLFMSVDVSVFVKMENIEYRVAIKYFHLKVITHG